MKTRRACLYPALVALALAGCDAGTSEPASTTDTPAPVPVGAMHLERAGSEAKLAAALAQGWEKYDDGTLGSQRTLGEPVASVEAMFDGAAPAAGAGGGPAGAGGGVVAGASGSVAVGGTAGGDVFTNAQVDGVEEPDVTKTDGNIVYVAEQPFRWIYPEVMPPVALGPVVPLAGTTTAPRAGLRVVPKDGVSIGIVPPEPVEPAVPVIARHRLSTTAPASVSVLPSLELPGIRGNVSRLEMLLSGGDSPVLAVLAQANDWSWQRWFAPVRYVPDQQLGLWLFDVRDADHVPAATHVELKGELVDSRRIGNRLYVVSRYSPSQAADPVMPAFTVDGTAHPVSNPADCLLSKKAGRDGWPSLTLVTAIDLHAPENTRATCYVGEVYTMYVSRDALYLASVQPNPDFVPPEVGGGAGGAGGGDSGGVTTGPVALLKALFIADKIPPSELRVAPLQTVIHRFVLGPSGPRYAGSGAVPGGFTGWLGAGSNPEWRFHERDGRLYVVTSWWSDSDLEHHLYVLESTASGDLEVVAQLPNALQPARIGKPREDIHAIRYVGDRAYIVTFRQTDPLYVLDLADPLAPRIAGELVMPGFSAYLHPVAEGWLLGVGQGATRGDVEANLFDVRDIEHPKVFASAPLCGGGCYAPLLTDFHAIATQPRDGGVRVAVPVQGWYAVTDERVYAPVDEAVLLEAAPERLAVAGRAAADMSYTGLGRVFLIADAVFQPQVGHVSARDWPLPVVAP